MRYALNTSTLDWHFAEGLGNSGFGSADASTMISPAVALQVPAAERHAAWQEGIGELLAEMSELRGEIEEDQVLTVDGGR